VVGRAPDALTWLRQFKTMKYRPDFPERFGAIEEGRAHCADFFGRYCD
jgi:putative transposase